MSNSIDNEEYYGPDIVSLSDDEGNEYEFEVLDETDYKGKHYYALIPLFDDPDNDISQDDTYMIFEAAEDENGDPQLAEIEDDELLDELAAIFESRMDENADAEDDDDDEENNEEK